MSLQLQKLSISVDDKEIVHDLDLTVAAGEVHVIMGPNGSGKSTLVNTLAGHPKYTVTGGAIVIDAVDITAAKPEDRAKAGLFLSPQYPPEIAGVTIANFLRLAVNAQRRVNVNPLEFYQEIKTAMQSLGIDESFAKRSLNSGFSGGEKKRAEILQLALLKPKYALLDETDSGLDVDALKIVGQGIAQFQTSERGILLITHYARLLEYVKPTHVHIMREGRIVKSGGPSLAQQIEADGYATFTWFYMFKNLIPRLICLVLLVPGIFYLRVGGALMLNNIELARTGTRVDAKVIGLHVSRDRLPGQTGTTANYVYTFEFTDNKNGKTIEVDSTHGYSQHWEPYNDQGLMPIVYNPNKPEQNRVNSFGRMWALPFVQVAFGAFMSFFGVMGLIPISWAKKLRGKS